MRKFSENADSRAPTFKDCDSAGSHKLQEPYVRETHGLHLYPERGETSPYSCHAQAMLEEKLPKKTSE